MKISNHRLVSTGPTAIPLVPSPNHSAGINPLYLIVHYTAGNTLDGAVGWFQKPEAKASSHLVIDRNGDVVQMVPFNRRAWHAGESRWGNLEGMNRYAIGIELVNCGKLQQRADGRWIDWAKRIIPDAEVALATHKNEVTQTGWHDYTTEQIERVIEVASVLHDHYEFTDVLGHDDVSPTRKVDPGPLFPMIRLRSLMLGRE